MCTYYAAVAHKLLIVTYAQSYVCLVYMSRMDDMFAYIMYMRYAVVAVHGPFAPHPRTYHPTEQTNMRIKE